MLRSLVGSEMCIRDSNSNTRESRSTPRGSSAPFIEVKVPSSSVAPILVPLEMEMVTVQGGTFLQGNYLRIPLNPDKKKSILRQRYRLAVPIHLNIGAEKSAQWKAGAYLEEELLDYLFKAQVKHLLVQEKYTANSLPMRQVFVDNFAIGKYPVTFEQYDFCLLYTSPSPRDS